MGGIGPRPRNAPAGRNRHRQLKHLLEPVEPTTTTPQEPAIQPSPSLQAAAAAAGRPTIAQPEQAPATAKEETLVEILVAATNGSRPYRGR